MTKKRKLPRDWESIRLGDHAIKIGSGVTPRGGQKVYQSSGIPFIRSQNVHLNRFERDGIAHISTEIDDGMSNSRVEQGDVLLNITGASIGRVCVVPDELCPANVNQHVSIIRSNGSFEPQFLSYYLSSPSFQKFIQDSQVGATRQALTRAMIEDFEIPLPPSIEEQRRIVAVLGEKLAAVAQARQAASAQLEAAQALTAAYLRAIFDTPQVKKWPRKRLGDGSELLPAKSIALDGDVQVNTITSACLSETGFQADGIKPGRMWSTYVDECYVSPGEILIARSNTAELVGRVSLYEGKPENIVASDLTIRIWPSKEDFEPQYLTYYLSFLFLSGYWRDKAGGSSQSMKKIRRGQILDLEIPLLSSQIEQENVAVWLNGKIMAVRKIETKLQKQLQEIEAMPTAYLRQAFNGQL